MTFPAENDPGLDISNAIFPIMPIHYRSIGTVAIRQLFPYMTRARITLISRFFARSEST